MERIIFSLKQIVTTAVIFLALFTSFGEFYAEEQGQKSQSVTTEGVIVFEEGEQGSVESTQQSQSITPVAKPSGTSKPYGKSYPATGEMIKKSLMYTGVGLILLFFLLLFWKKRKKEEEKG